VGVERPLVFGAQDDAGLVGVVPLPVGLAFVGEDDVLARLYSDAVQLGHVVERGEGVRESGERGVVVPGIRTPVGSPATRQGTMTLGEGTIINGTGVQTTANSRWGDYTSVNVDPVDDCTFWYTNEYYTAAGQATSPAGWPTRIASFKLPGC
jgi:hypothetical protein